jgi:hypothetical protein
VQEEGTEMQIAHLENDIPNIKIEAALSEGAGKHVRRELGCQIL